MQSVASERRWRLEKYTQEQIQKAADKAVEKCGDRLNVTEYWTDGQILNICFQAVPLIKKVVTVKGPPRTVTLRYYINVDGTMERECLNLHDDEEIERLGGLYVVRVTVRWGDRFRGHGESESYITFWRKPE